ncbi:MAG TPA: response regulator [Methylomirabilota bacterium]|nr:response regulator [Methylomirabilota bacterium]
MRVLIVEDEPDVGAVFHDFLLELGHEPVLVRTAEAALSRLETDRPDAILLDITLPGLSGLEFLQLRPVRTSGLPIVVVSGVATESQARQCLRLGAMDFIGKPVALDRLGEVLACLEPHALQRQLVVAERARDRRGNARVRMTFPVRIIGYDGTQSEGWAFDLSPTGIRIRSGAAPPTGIAVRLVFAPPDGRGSMSVVALLVRSNEEGHAFRFANLTAPELERLTAFARYASF